VNDRWPLLERWELKRAGIGGQRERERKKRQMVCCGQSMERYDGGGVLLMRS